MKKNIKLILGLLIVLGASMAPAFSQQITKFGVVDTDKIYKAYFRDTSAVRKYNSKREEFQKEIDRLTDELKEIQRNKQMFIKAGDKDMVNKLNAEISKKSKYLTEYANAKQNELKTMEMALENDDEFYKKLQKTLAKVAESGGYSMVLSLQDNDAILWFSSSVDITNDVMKELGL